MHRAAGQVEGEGEGGRERSSSRLRDRLARMFRPAALLRSTCNATTSTCSSSSSSSSSTPTAPKPPPPPSACSSSRALLADAALARDSASASFLASSRRHAHHLVARTDSFSTALDRLHRRVAPAPSSRFSLDAPPSPLPPPDCSRAARALPAERETTRLGALVKNNDDRMMKTCNKLLSNPYGFSTDDDDTDASSSDDDDPAARAAGATKKLLTSSAETFFSSSRSFSSDSSEFYTNTTKKKKNKKNKQSNKTATGNGNSNSNSNKPPLPPPTRARARARTSATTKRSTATLGASCDTCGVRDGFRPVVSAAEEQLRKGFAVVKRSRDPYADFRSSMVEMIVGRQLMGPPDLERLLRSYLALNAPRHHPVILQAFSDIWVVLHAGG